MVTYNDLRSVLFRNGCKFTAKLNHDSNLISFISWPNHGHSEYNNDIYNAVQWEQVTRLLVPIYPTNLEEGPGSKFTNDIHQ